MKNVTRILVTVCVLSAIFIVPALAADTPSDAFEAAGNLISDVSSTILLLSTPAAGIGVGTGAFMQKFSGGDQQKVGTGKKVVTGSIVSWGVLNGLPLILGTIQNYLG